MMENPELKEKRKKEKTINDLDDDSLLGIFSFLNIRYRTRCESVCRRWNQLLISSWSTTKSLVFKDAFCLWQDNEILDMATLEKILKKCPNLKSINLEQASADLDEKTCEIIGECCPNLEKLVLRDTDLSKYSVTIIGRSCPQLKSIDFSKCGNISEKSLWELLHARPDMESISLSQVSNITGKCFYLLTALSYLDLSGCMTICTEAFSKLGQNCSQTLKTLKAPPINNAGLQIICNTFLNLECLEAEMSTEVVDSFTVCLSGARLLGNLTKLQKLRFIPELSDLDNDALLSIMQKCPDLRELSLFGTDKFSDLSVVELPEYCTNLRKLSLEGSKIGDDSLRALVDLKKLAVLKIAGSSITDDGAIYFIKNCASLELLSVNQCLGITKKTLEKTYDLFKEGSVSKDFIIEYNFNRIKVSTFSDKNECENFEGSGIWAEDEEDGYPGDDEDADYDDYVAYGDYENYDYIVDGDFDSEEEELT